MDDDDVSCTAMDLALNGNSLFFGNSKGACCCTLPLPCFTPWCAGILTSFDPRAPTKTSAKQAHDYKIG